MERTNRYASGPDALVIRIAAAILLIACAVALLRQTAFAQTTYVINDGGTVKLHTTSATDPEAVLTEAGLELGKDDTYITQDGTGISEITVQRSQTVNLTLNGQTMQISTYGETVEELLQRIGVTVENLTDVSLPMDTVLKDGMSLEIRQHLRSVQTYTVPVDFKTVYQEDPNLPEGEQRVLSQGAPGAQTYVASVEYEAGVEVDRVVLSKHTDQKPQNRVIAVGTGKAKELAFGQAPRQITDHTITTATGEVLTYTDVIQVVATGYNNTNEGCNEFTATGTRARVGAIAVDPRMIPYGTRMFIVSNDGSYVYGVATAEDCGGAIRGSRIDLYFDTNAECFQFGIRDCTVYILG